MVGTVRLILLHTYTIFAANMFIFAVLVPIHESDTSLADF